MINNKKRKSLNKNIKLKMKNEKGITLVALVVTIIVLMILAGVSISLVLGENGIITKSKYAKQETLNAQIGEQEELNELAEYLGNMGGTQTDEPEETDPPQGGDESGANAPNDTKIAKKEYVTWTEKDGTYEINETSSKPSDWYDYENGKWANIKTTSSDGVEAYYFWIQQLLQFLRNEKNKTGGII